MSKLILPTMTGAAPLILGDHIGRSVRQLNASGRLDGLMLRMHCDGQTEAKTKCRQAATKSPAIFVPSKTPLLDGHRQLRMFTALHCCTDHIGLFTLDDLLNDRQKAQFEDLARAARPIDFKCDFDAAHLTYTDVASGSYQAFLAQIEVGRA